MGAFDLPSKDCEEGIPKTGLGSVARNHLRCTKRFAADSAGSIHPSGYLADLIFTGV